MGLVGSIVVLRYRPANAITRATSRSNASSKRVWHRTENASSPGSRAARASVARDRGLEAGRVPAES